MTLKEKFNAAKAALGGEKADALIEQMEVRLKAKLGHSPTLKQRTAALEQLAIESRRRPAPSDEQRRAFDHRLAEAASKARARFQLPATGKASELVMTKKDWLALSPYKRGQFQVRGGKIIPETMKRSLFQKLPPRDRADFCRDGGQLTDD